MYGIPENAKESPLFFTIFLIIFNWLYKTEGLAKFFLIICA